MKEQVMLELTVLLRLGVAAVLSAIIGWERESSGKAAGLRTHMAVGVTAALFGIVGELSIARYGAVETLNFDPLRMISAIATGVGFLGAGTIFLSRGEARVKGLTTAATIWATSAVGLAAGLEYYVVASGAVVLLVVVLRLMQGQEDPDD